MRSSKNNHRPAGRLNRLLVSLLPVILSGFVSFNAFADQTKIAECNSGLQKIGNIYSLTPGPGQTVVDPSEISILRLATYNLENFFIYAGSFERNEPNRLSRSNGRPKGLMVNGVELKSELDRRAMERMIEQQIKADIMSVQEIDGENSIDLYAKDYLESLYEGTSRKGNDSRGIQIGTFDNRKYPFEVELRQNTETKWVDPADNSVQKLFSRDLTISIYRIKGFKIPFEIKVSGHGKSKRPRPGDPESTRLRSAQYIEAGHVIERLQQEFGVDAPITFDGDMNTSVINGPELEPIRKLGFRDVLDLANVPLAERITHTFHPRDGATHKDQMDAIFLSPSLQPYLKGARVHRYYDDNGALMPIAETFQQRSKQPSDHLPLSADIDYSYFIARSLSGPRTITGN